MDMFFTENWFHLWLRPLRVDNDWKLALTCCSLVVMATLIEALRAARAMLTTERGVGRWRSRNRWLQIILHFIQAAAGHLLMLAVMTFSPWVLLSVCLGAAIGYALFAPLQHPPEGEEEGDRGADRKGTLAGAGSYRRLDEEEVFQR